MDTFEARLSVSKVIWFSNNQNVESILLNGSKKLDLQALVLQDFPICLKYRISLNDRWIPGDIILMPEIILSGSLLILTTKLTMMLLFRQLVAIGARIPSIPSKAALHRRVVTKKSRL